MKNYLVVSIGIVLVVGVGAGLVLNKKQRIPLPPELEKERQEAEEMYAEYRKENPGYNNNMASHVQSECPECSWTVNNLNNVADIRNDLIKRMEDIHNTMLDLSDKLRLSVYDERNEWIRVTDLPQYDAPDKSLIDSIKSFFGIEGKIYDIVMPEDIALVKNPNKILIKEEDLVEYRRLQQVHKSITDSIMEYSGVYAKLETERKKIEDQYAKAITDFNECTGAPACKDKSIKSDSANQNKEEAFSTSILIIHPIEEHTNGDNQEFEPNIYNRQKLGHADYASRTKFKIIKEVSCGKTEGIAFWERNENNPMGIRWDQYECKKSAITPVGHFVVEMYFDNKKFAQCEYNVPGGSKPCERFDK